MTHMIECVIFPLAVNTLLTIMGWVMFSAAVLFMCVFIWALFIAVNNEY